MIVRMDKDRIMILPKDTTIGEATDKIDILVADEKGGLNDDAD